MATPAGRFSKKSGVTTTNRFCSTGSIKREKTDTGCSRLSADIRSELHTQLKLYAVSNKRTIVEIIEEWIPQHCQSAPQTVTSA